MPPLAVLSAGDRVTILGSAGAWTNVQTPDGKVGYVHHRYVATAHRRRRGDLSWRRVRRPHRRPAHPLPRRYRRPPEPTTTSDSDALSSELADLQAEVSRLTDRSAKYKQNAAEAPLVAVAEPPAAQPDRHRPPPHAIRPSGFSRWPACRSSSAGFSDRSSAAADLARIGHA